MSSMDLHDYYLKKFDECWVPDFENSPNLSGKLGHDFNKKVLPIKYIGVLSRLEKERLNSEFDIMVLLSGPEPQRGLLEKKLFEELTNFEGNILFVKGSITNDNDLKRVFHEKSTCIFHLETFFVNQNSADYPEKDLMVSQLCTTKILEYCLLLGVVKQFAYADSGNNI